MSPKRFKIFSDSPVARVKGVIFRIRRVGVLEIRHPNVSERSTYCNHSNRSSGSLTEVALRIFYSMKKDSQQPLVGSQTRPWSPLYPVMWERNGSRPSLVCLSASPQSFPSNYAGGLATSRWAIGYSAWRNRDNLMRDSVFHRGADTCWCPAD